MKSDDQLTAEECKAVVLAILTAIEQGHHDAAVEIAGLAGDPARLRKILSAP